jgi:hypothetical protein
MAGCTVGLILLLVVARLLAGQLQALQQVLRCGLHGKAQPLYLQVIVTMLV